MTEDVIRFLEAVEIDVSQRQVRRFPLGHSFPLDALEGAVEPILEKCAIGHAGQWILQRSFAQLAL